MNNNCIISLKKCKLLTEAFFQSAENQIHKIKAYLLTKAGEIKIYDN